MRKFLAILISALPAFVATLIYGYSVRLPLYLDDGILYTNIRDYGANGVPLLRFWGGSTSFQYYRPMVFSIFEVNYALEGHLNAFMLHLLNLLLFVLAVCAVSAIARRMTRRPAVGLIAGSIVALFPFNFNAVLWVASLFHVVMLTALVVALCCALMWLDKRRGVLPLIVCWLSAFVGMFSHENGVILVPLLLALAFIVYGWRSWLTRRMLILVLPLIALTVVYLFLWFTLPRPAASLRLVDLGMIPGSLAVAVQGLIYPIASLWRRLTMTDARTVPLLAVSGVVVVAMIVLAGKRYILHLFYGVGWYLLASLPTLLFLETGYFRGSPRLLLLSSVGAGLFWAIALYGAWTNRQRILRYVGRVTGVLLIVGFVAVGVLYAGARKMEALKQADYMWYMVEHLPVHQEGGVLLVNSPAFLASLDANRLFLTTSEAVMFMEGSYTNYAQEIQAMTGIGMPAVSGLVSDVVFVPPPSYVFAPYWTEVPENVTARLLNFPHIYVTRFDGDNFAPIYVGGAGMAGLDTPIARFPDVGITLTEASASWDGAEVILRTRWQVDAPVDAQPVISLYCDETLVTQSTFAVWGGTYPFSVWQAGEIQTDLRPIEWTQARECLRATVGLTQNGEAVTVETPEGEAIEGDAVPMTVQQDVLALTP
jgi:hypothetical protein